MQLGLAVLRAIVGGLFFGHGTQKLAGWFGGDGLKATGRGLRVDGPASRAPRTPSRPARPRRAVACCSPRVRRRRVAAAAISGTMITAIRKVHAPKGPWVTEGGYEYNLVLLAVVFALTDAGPGKLSIDALRGRERWGLRWALAQLGAAAARLRRLAIELGTRAGQLRAGAVRRRNAGAGRQERSSRRRRRGREPRPPARRQRRLARGRGRPGRKGPFEGAATRRHPTPGVEWSLDAIGRSTES